LRKEKCQVNVIIKTKKIVISSFGYFSVRIQDEQLKRFVLDAGLNQEG
jgi:hypothetical protein